MCYLKKSMKMINYITYLLFKRTKVFIQSKNLTYHEHSYFCEVLLYIRTKYIYCIKC